MTVRAMAGNSLPTIARLLTGYAPAEGQGHAQGHACILAMTYWCLKLKANTVTKLANRKC